jgi:hypothetical protein
MTKQHLKLDVHVLYDDGFIAHPQIYMKQIGITYQHATPQSLGDQWWFWNCENIPEELPKCLSILYAEPHDMIGFGLSLDDAIKIKEGE